MLRSEKPRPRPARHADDASRSECVFGPGRGSNQAIGHLLACELNECGSRTMHGNDDVRIDLLELCHRLAHIVVIGRKQMEPANHCVDLRYTGDIDRLAHGIHDTDMPTGRNDHQPAVLNVETGSMLVPVLVRYELAFGLGVEHRHLAAEPLSLMIFDGRIRQHALERPTLDVAGRERVSLNDSGLLTLHDSHSQRLELPMIEHAPVGEMSRCTNYRLAIAEVVLPPDVESQVGGKVVAVPLQKSDEAAEMVEMP